MKSTEIRQKFFDFFKKHNHTHVTSSPLIPAEDPTLLFANAGMNQFKDCFLGNEKRSYTRAVTIQKCIRAGGKHNDLDNVGRTKRHLTFFEMMGNFSFGDYFKEDAIKFAWKFLTEELKIPAEKLHISIFTTDDESYNIWHKKMGIPADRIVRLGASENFWQMGETGPCGPCTEIHYDKGAQTPEEEQCKVGDDCERFLEIWNLVFMQYNRQEDGTDVPLAQPGVDTGMGLERLCAVMQNVDSAFEIDIFANYIKKIEQLSGKNYYKSDTETQTAFRVLSDHIRSTGLAIADGGTPSNEGRGYVLRKIIRRAALFAQKLGDIMIFPQLTDTLVEEMKSYYPEIVTNQELIKTVLTSEIKKFEHNLLTGREILKKYLKESADTKIITGEQAFKLYDTYGFPSELTNLVAHEKGYSVDALGFAQAMEEQQIKSGKKINSAVEEISIDRALITSFVGYDQEKLSLDSTVTALITHGQESQTVTTDQECWVITEQTPFYGASGGQVNDQGTLKIGTTSTEIKDVKTINNARALHIIAPANITVGDIVTLAVDVPIRTNTSRNHTATHLLQSALVEILGPHTKQAGSLVTPDYLRFDFTHHQPISADEIIEIENLVNQKIIENIPVTTTNTTYKKAVESGAKAFFGEKYNPDNVRMVTIPEFSIELCGGTHVPTTGTIGSFKITINTALSAGVRRIAAVTGPQALGLFQESYTNIKTLAQKFKVETDKVIAATDKQEKDLKQAQTYIKKLKKELFNFQIPSWIASTEDINGVPFGYIELDDVPSEELRDLGNLLTQKKPGFYFLVSTRNGTSNFFAILSQKFESRINLQDFSIWLRNNKFKGGGKNGVLQGGGGKVSADFKENIIKSLS